MYNSTAPCSTADENAFGPQVRASCLHGFDFTLLFEESILTIAPLGIALLLLPFRVCALWKAPGKVYASWLYVLKVVALSLFVVLQIVLLALWSNLIVPRSKATIATTALTLVGFLSFLYLSHLEHFRSVRPSTLLNIYLGVSLLLDIARLRTLWYIPGNQPVAAIFAASFALKGIILILEATEKRALLKPAYRNSGPEATSGVLNRSLFLWLNGLFWKGFKSLLSVDTLVALDNEITLASEPSQQLVERWNRADKSRSNALLWTFAVHYKWSILAGVLPRLACTGFSFAQPFLVKRVLDYMKEREDPNTKNIAYGLIAAYGLVYLGIAISYTVYRHKTYRVITMFRGSLVALLFDKTLRLNITAVSDAAALTLMSADIDRIGTGLRELHELYSSWIELALALWLLKELLGLAMAASTVFVTLCLLAGIPLAVAAGNAQTKWLEAIEKRIAVTSRMLGAMKAIKMTGLTDLVSATIAALREQEICASGLFRLYTVFNITLSYASSALAPAWGFGLYILHAKAKNTETLTDGIAFSALTLFELLDRPMVSLIDGVEQTIMVVNCFRRIQEHLLIAERRDYRQTPCLDLKKPVLLVRRDSDSSSFREKVDIINELLFCAAIREVSAGWISQSKQGPVLKGLNFDIRRGKTTMIIGPVGCGKSTLLKLLLGELPEVSGSVMTAYTRAAYCSQSPWITFGTIQQNILGASMMDRDWYNTVIQACALQPDLQEFAQGDQTTVGNRGARLSGGQQMRVALARALYSREPIMIFDDVLTGLDQITEQKILESVFSKQGLLKHIERTVILATNSAHHLSYADYLIILGEDGCIVDQGSFDEISAAGYIERFNTSQPQAGAAATAQGADAERTDQIFQEFKLPKEDDKDFSRQTGDLTVYMYYFRAIGWLLLSLFGLCSMVFVFAHTFPDIWLQWWTRANETKPNQNIGLWLGVYAAFGGLTFLITLLLNWLFLMMIVPRTARRFHETLLCTTMGATTSFLTSTDIGNTTNRFSQDLELIDMELPSTFELTMVALLSCIAEGVLVFVGSSYLAAAVPGFLVAVFLVQKFYLCTSRQLRLLDIEAKAPLFSQFLEALSGVASIRAYGWTDEYRRRNREALDTSQRPYYLLFCIQRWLNLVLDILVALLAVMLVGIATGLRGKGSLEFLGVALFNIVGFSRSLQQLITQWTGLETAIGAVSRIRSYVMRTKPESSGPETDTISKDWPKNGGIEFVDVSASYGSSLQPVLKSVNLVVHPGEKIALCGRTGSGKSSFVAAILRILDLSSGSIVIDKVDISTIPRDEIRGRLSTLPQEPFFLHGSVRFNLDPRGSESDKAIIAALKAVQLWDFISSKGGLDAAMSEDLLSHGQRQLFCLARAMCKPASILLLDEATSWVDSQTDKLMQEIIQTTFQDRTIIAIVHKLQTILGFDKVAVMDKGRVVEYDAPRTLLARDGSAFKALFESLRHEGRRQ